MAEFGFTKFHVDVIHDKAIQRLYIAIMKSKFMDETFIPGEEFFIKDKITPYSSMTY